LIRNKAYRATIGAVLALGLLSAVPAAVMAAPLTCGTTLTTSRTLSADLDCSGYSGNALTMGANGLVLNLNGHKIWGPTGDEGDYGVDTDGYNGTTIKNGTINHYYAGVYVNGSNRTLVQSMTFNGENNGDYGVYVSYGVRNTLANVTTDGTEIGVYAEYGASLTIKNSTLRGDTSNSDGYGLYLYEDTGDNVTSNHFTGYYGAYDYESHRQTYTGNTSNNNYYGIYLDCESYGTANASGNTTNGNYYGMYIYECYVVDHPLDGYIASRITGNTANGNVTGFYDYYSINSLYKSNTANDNSDDGFYFDYPANISINYNVARRNGDSGIEISDNYSWYNVNTLNYNTAIKNAYGLYAGYGVPDATGNTVSGNTSLNCYNVDC